MENQDTFSRITLSGRSADNLENSGRPNNPPVSLINHPSTTRQLSITNRQSPYRLPHEKEPPSQ